MVLLYTHSLALDQPSTKHQVGEQCLYISMSSYDLLLLKVSLLRSQQANQFKAAVDQTHCVLQSKIYISVNGVWWIWQERYIGCFWSNTKDPTLSTKGTISVGILSISGSYNLTHQWQKQELLVDVTLTVDVVHEQSVCSPSNCSRLWWSTERSPKHYCTRSDVYDMYFPVN